jgi:pyruvate/2-oxoglutarate dehydrogenase complex dihydrolipoamide acyltransferase (E2) component
VLAGLVMRMSLTFDHCVVNGMRALAFFDDLVRRLRDDPPNIATMELAAEIS